MTTSANSPALDAELSGLKRRVSDLERALADRARFERPDTTFVLAGPIYLSTSPPYPVPQRRHYWEAAVELGTASSSGAVTVEIAVGGAAVATLTVPAGATSITQPVDFTVSRNGTVTAEITAVGSGAADLTVCLRT